MTNAITAGSILLEPGTLLPKSLGERVGSLSKSWEEIQGATSTFEKAVQYAGWTFFFMAGEIKANVFGFDRKKAVRAALKRLLVDVKSQRCNGIEISHIVHKTFCGMPYVSVSAHARHLQSGMLFSG